MEEEHHTQSPSQQSTLPHHDPSPATTSHDQDISPQINTNILLTHPLFKQESDPLLSVLVKIVKSFLNQSIDPSLLKTQNSRWFSILHQTILNNLGIPTLKEEFQKFGLSFDTICGKFIANDEIYFRCLDCDKFKDTTSSIYALLCSECFENSDHAGHRVLMVKKDSNCSATCDCGDHTAFDHAGFCKDHQPKDFYIKETLGKFPPTFLQRCLVLLKNSFYGAISLFEIANAANDDSTRRMLTEFAQLTLEGTLAFCGTCYNEVNEAFLVVFGEIFKSNFLETSNQVWHFCEDTTAEKGVKAVDPAKPHPCTCSIGANMIRIGNVIDYETQGKLHRVLVECARETSFKSFLIREFTKYIHFLYSQSYSSDEFEDNSNSRLLNMKAQLYGTEELCLQALDSGYFQNLMSVMKRTIYKSQQATNEVYHITSDVRSSLIYFLNNKNKASSMLIKDSPLLSQALEILTNFQLKFFYEDNFDIGLFEHQVNYRSINRGLMIEKVVSQVLEQGIRVLSNYPTEEKATIIQKLTREWLACFETTKGVRDEELKNGVFSFHPVLERTLTSLLQTFGNELTEEGVTKFFRDNLPGVDLQSLAGKVVEGALRSLGMVRFVHLAHNFNSGNIWHVYYFANNLFFEMDILTIQLMAAVVDPETLFERFAENFFSYNKDLQGFFQNPDSLSSDDERLKQKIMVIEDFLHLLIYIMNDETSRFNSKVGKDIHVASEESELSPKCHSVIEKVLINLLLGHYWVDVPQLKESMKSVLISHSDVDNILHKVAVFDEKTKKVRIKDEYQNEFDPYIFYRNPALQSDITQNIASKAKKDQKTDLVSGKYYSNLPSYLKGVQRKIFQSSLPKHLTRFLNKFQKHTEILVRPVLKLILLNLQVAEEALHEVSAVNLLTRVKESYLTQEFTSKLNELLQKIDLKDCEACIGKIQKLIETLSGKLQNGASLSTEAKESTSHEDHVALKKKLAHQRMMQLKEEFMKKQKLFMHKNTPQQSQGTENGEEGKVEDEEIGMENEEHGITCQFCLDKVNKGTDRYGMPVYVGFTNNLYDPEEAEVSVKKDECPEKLEGDWWPTVSSCMHYYHEKCFNSHYKNSRNDGNPMDKLFGNQFETHCSLCNTLCNAFMVEEGPKIMKTPNQEGNDTITEEKGEDSEQVKCLSFVEATKELLTSLKGKLRLDVNKEMEEETAVEVEEIFRKGYTYFMETFHLADKTSALEKMFSVYQVFMKEYISHIRKNHTSTDKVIPQVFTDKPFFNSSEAIEKKISSLVGFKPETVLNEICFESLVRFSTNEGAGEKDIIREQLKVLKDYVSFKVIQLILFCKESSVTLDEAYLLYEEDEELREDVLEALLFPLQKFVLATYLTETIMKGETKLNEKLFETLLFDPENNISQYLDKLLSFVGLGDSVEKIIKDSLHQLKNDSAIAEIISQMLAYDTVSLGLVEPRNVKLSPRMIELPETYSDFTTVYFKNKCGQCKEYSRHMSTYICLICGEIMCLSYCPTVSPQKRGNLNTHAKQCHLGSSIYIEIQNMSKVIVSCYKNSMFGGKDVYHDKLGQGIQNLINDMRCPLYSLDFSKFTLNEEFVKNAKQMLEQCGMGKEIYRLTKSSGYYYPDGHL